MKIATLLTAIWFLVVFSACLQEETGESEAEQVFEVPEEKTLPGDAESPLQIPPPPGEVGEKAAAPVKETWRWVKEEGVRVTDGSVPYAVKLEDGREGVRLYYCSEGGILSAVSEDGLSFKKEPGTRLSASPGEESIVCDPTITEINGGFRMYYKGADGPGGPGESVHRIFSAISEDGLSWKKEGVRIDSLKTPDKGWASVPEAVKLPDGRIRLYYVSDEGPHGIATAVSRDGLSFDREPGIILPDLVDPSVILRNGSYIMFATSINPRYLPQGIYMLKSMDGRVFELNQKPIIEGDRDRGVFDPAAILLEDGSIRVYYGEYPYRGAGAVIKSLLGKHE